MFVAAICLGLICIPAAFADSNPSNTVVRFQIQRGTNSLGAMDVELFDSDKPQTVANFLLYVRSGAYSNIFLHRCLPGFVVQSGGFAVTNALGSNLFSSYREVTNYGRLTNEFFVGPRLTNTFGTIAMAKVGGDPNSATSQWFFNLGNNSTNLDLQNGGFTVFGRVLENTNASEGTNLLRHFNTLSNGVGIVNLGSLLGSAYSVFSDLPVAYTNTAARVPANRELYYAQISILTQTNQPGTLRPWITMTNGPNLRFTNTTVVIGGTASDDTSVTRVVYRLQNGPLEIATGTTNWAAALTPVAGFNTVTAQSVDTDGNFSSNTVSTTFFYVSKMPLNLQIVGSGYVTGATSNMPVLAGRFYTLTATPAKNKLFEGWSGSVTSSSPTLTFQVPANATNFNLTAKFIENPFIIRAGTYVGLFRSATNRALENVGSVTLTLANNGAFSGRIFHRGGTYRFVQVFDRNGATFLQGSVGGVSRFFNLQIDTTNITDVITGSAGTDLEIRLERMASVLPASNGPPAGYYSFVLPRLAPDAPSQLLPGGDGFGTGTLDARGTLRLYGTLGDGSAFTTIASMTRLRNWAVYAVQFGGRGVLAGWINSPTNNPAGQLGGNLQWVKPQGVSLTTYPAGFSNSVDFVAAPYVPPARGARVLNWVTGLAEISGADVFGGLTNQVKLVTNNTLTFLDANTSGLKVTLDTRTALVQGSFVHPWTGGTSRLRGILFQGDGSIRGQFLDGDQTGGFTVRKSTFLAPRSITNLTLAGLVDALREGGSLRFESNGVIAITNTLIVPYDTSFDANGHEVVFTGGGQTRLFEIRSGANFIANNITFADGRYFGTNGAVKPVAKPGADGCGAGILNLGGVVALTNCVLTNFFVRGGDAGDVASNTTNGLPGGRGLGAAICNHGGVVTLQSCQLADNLAVGGKGNADAFTGRISNQRGTALGGAIASHAGAVEVRDSIFLRNQVQGGDAWQKNGGNSTQGGDAAGGALAILGGQFQLVGSQCRSNSATGPTATNVFGGGSAHGGVLFVESNVVASVEQTVFTGNSVTGGVSGLAVQSALGEGGALHSAGTLRLQECIFEQNTACGGDGIKSGAGFGGAVASTGSLIMNACTLNENLALGGNGSEWGVTNAPGAVGAGGAIHAAGGFFSATNSTLAFNRATGGSGANLTVTNVGPRGDGRGGALSLISNATTLVHLTLAFNQAAAGSAGDTNSGSASGGGIASDNGTVTLRGTLFATNTPANVVGAFTDLGYNLSSDTNGGFNGTGSRTNLDPILGPLSNYGGFTRTMVTRFGSPARDVVPSGFPPVDQRGVSRPQPAFGSADIGAYESDGEQDPPSFVTLPFGGNPRYGSSFTLLAQAQGGQPISYYWLKNGNLLADATNAAVAFTNIQPADAGDYVVVATNAFGVTTGTVAYLTVNSTPLLLSQPSNSIVSPGGTVAFTVGVDGPLLNYRWFHNTGLLADATNATLAISNATAGAQGNYQVIVTNFAGAVTSVLATLTFDAHALEILDQPDGITVTEGENASFSLLVSGIPPFYYQWRYQNAPLANGTNSSLTLAGVSPTNAGYYTVIVTNAYLSLTSAPALLSVVSLPILSIRADNSNVFVTCRGTALRVHRLLSAGGWSPGDAWMPLATNTLPVSGITVWTLPLPTNSPTFYRAVSP